MLGALPLALTVSGSGGAQEIVKGNPVPQIRKALRQLRTEGDACGLKLQRKAQPYRPGSYAAVVEASPFQLAFYADLGPGHTPLPSAKLWQYGGSPVKAPDAYKGLVMKKKPWGVYKATKGAEQYFSQLKELGEHAKKLPREQQRKAELVLYTLDENGDGKVDAADRDGEHSKQTPDKNDNTLLRYVFKTDVSEEGKPSSAETKEVVATGLNVPLDASDNLGAKALPLFVYRLSERFARFDFNGDGDKSDELIFGDSNGNMKLDPDEIKKLLETNSKDKPSLADNLEIDERFLAHGDGEDAVASLADRLKEAHKLTGDKARGFMHNSIVRADLAFIVEYVDEKRNARVRRRMRGAADFRNAIMRLRGMTR